MEDKNGVTITSRELYDSIQALKQEMSQSNIRIETRLLKLETLLENVKECDERSRKALKQAENAKNEAQSAKKQADKVENRQLWLWGVVISAIIIQAIRTFFSIQGG